MISKLPRWVWLGGWVLAFVAGMVNVVSLLGFEHQAVSHLTASTSRLSVTALDGDLKPFRQLVFLILSFVGGAILSGWLIKGRALQLGRHYSVVLLIESMLLCAAVLCLQRHSILGVYLSSCACGLQNAMASNYSGAIVRTTHMTGMFTDLGIIIGQWLRGIAPDWRRLLLCGSIISGFIVGSAASAVAFPFMRYHTLLIPAALTGIAALSFSYYRWHLRRTRRYQRSARAKTNGV